MLRTTFLVMVTVPMATQIIMIIIMMILLLAHPYSISAIDEFNMMTQIIIILYSLGCKMRQTPNYYIGGMILRTTIYLVRHGESEANKRNAFLGHGDLDITPAGHRQACAVAQFFADKIGRPDVIYASDLARAYNTAKCTAEKFNMPIIKNQNLREIRAGLWENVPFQTLAAQFSQSYETWLHNIGYARCDDGESVAELQARIVSEITRIAQKHKDAVVFLFTHATPIRTFAAHCLQKTLDELKTVPWCSNASVTKVVYEAGQFSLEEYSRDDFMGDLITKLPTNV